jgi:hypothetical protein
LKGEAKMAVNGKFSPTEQAIINILSDGTRHTREELFECVDYLSKMSVVRKHVCKIREVLRPIGQDIVCEYWYGKLYYRHVRLLASAVDGKR